MKFTLNGEVTEYTGSPERSLLRFLRDERGLIAPKDGCSQGVCGSCSVLINDRAQQSCILKMGHIQEDSAIETVEGFKEREKRIFAKAFVEKGGVQCGFCTPGMLIAGKALLTKTPQPDRSEVIAALRKNLCRCTGYHKIVDSIEHAAALFRSGPALDHVETDQNEALLDGSPRARQKRFGVGARLKKYDAERTVLGQRPFVADLSAENLLYGALCFSDHPHAKILSLSIDRAMKIEGVTAVFIASDIPGFRKSGLIFRDWPLMIDVGGKTHYIGDVVAQVIAETPSIAREAVAAIEVTYDVYKPITTVEEALEQGAPVLHESDSNILSRSSINRGTPQKVLTESAFIAKGTYRTQCVEHAFLEVESCMAVPSEDIGTDVHVYSQGQGIYEDQRQIAALLGVPEERVSVELVPNGGGFGGKEDLSVQGHAALACFLLKRPVKFVLSRDESMRMHPKKHPMTMNYRLGCDRNGKLTVLIAEIEADSGAYASVGMKVIERAVGHATGCYSVPHVSVSGLAVYTHNIPNGAMRGFGANQVTFAMESAVEQLCEMGRKHAISEGKDAGVFDPLLFRMNNVLKPGDLTATGQHIGEDAGALACLKAVSPYYHKAVEAGKFAGLACAIKNTGVGNGMPDECTVKIEVLTKGRMRVHHGWTEMGQGVFTMCQQVLCEEIDITPSEIDVIVHTAFKTPAGMTTSSRATSLVGNALLNACSKLKKALKNGNRFQMAGQVFEGYWVCDWTTKPSSDTTTPVTHFSYSYAAQCVILDEKGKIEHVVAAHDAGRVMNPTLFEGQIEGSIHMGLGYAITEEFRQKDAKPVSTKLGKCGVLRATQMPPVTVIPVEIPDLHGPYGAKGVGEIGLVPTAGAVGNALLHFDGVARTRLPFKERFLIK